MLAAGCWVQPRTIKKKMTSPARSSDLTYASCRSGLSYVLAAVIFLAGPPLFAHDIPADALMQLFVKPDGQRLHVLVRAPMSAMRDVDYPLRGPGYLQLDRVDPYLAQAADLWIENGLAIYEGPTRLGAPRLVAARISLPSDKSFASYDDAVAHLRATPLPTSTDLIWNQGWLDVEY